MDPKYRADIDGLRAIAVLSVIFFHTEIPGFSGGFVGVDVFFVISGYLITSIILNEIKAEQFSIARFYERRIRRIFPALFSVIAFVFLVGAYFLDANAFKGLGLSTITTTLFGSNILFWRESGYFAAPSFHKPLLHTWSLAVEEQFYIIFPLALMVIQRYLKGRYSLWMIIAMVISLGASIYGVSHHPAATFYLVPTRAWELMIGSILALGALPDLSSNWQRNVFTLTGLALIIFSIISYNKATPFPGIAALVPVIGSGMIIYSGKAGGHAAQKVLTAPFLVFIGLISYSLYLWHWPLLVFWKYLIFRPINVFDSIAIIITSIALAAITWKFVEQPFRMRHLLLPNRKKLFLVSGIVMFIAICIGKIVCLRHGMPERIPSTVTQIIDNAKNDPVYNLHREWDKLTKKIGSGMIPPVIGTKSAKPSFALIGDSHARAIIPSFELNAEKNGISGYSIAMSGTPFLKDIDWKSSNANINFLEYNNAVMDFIGRNPNIKTVVLAGRWGGCIKGGWKEKTEEWLKLTFYDGRDHNIPIPNAYAVKTGLQRSIDTLLVMNRKVVLVADVPEIGYNVPSAFFVYSRLPSLLNLDSLRPTIAEYRYRQKEANAILEGLAKTPGVSLIRPESRMFDESGKGRIMVNSELLYIDDDHLSTAGALYVAPVFEKLFKEMAADYSKARKLSRTNKKSFGQNL